MQLKMLLRSKRKPLTKMKRQPTEWEKILANDAIHKGLISKIYINSYTSTTTKKPNKKKKWAKYLNRHFSK